MSTVTEQPITASVQAFYDALARGDVEEVARICSPDVTVRLPGDGPLSGRYEGRDASLGLLEKMQAAARGTYRAELRGLYAGDGQVVALHHGTATREEKVLDAEAALVFEVSGGAITAITVHQARQDNWDDFFS
jgi:hypothetical protein